MEATNGYSNGYSKGPKMNSHAPVAKKNASKGPTLFGRLFSITSRLLTWYAIITILFRCPATLELCDESSPKLCMSYFQVKEAVTPHVKPYYDTHAAPYVDIAKPYYDVTNERVIAPASSYVARYGGPALHQAQAYGQAHWDKTIQPKIDAYQETAKAKYDEQVAPHVAQISTVIGPYYEITRVSALQTYHEILLPSYELAQPYLAQAYGVTSRFTTETALPTACLAWNKTTLFLDTTVWPQVRDLYVENVEPQLARIGQRLGRYKEKSKAAVENAPESITSEASSFTKPTPSVSADSADAGNSNGGGGIKVKPKPKTSSSKTATSKPTEKAHVPDPAEVAEHDENDQVTAPPAGDNESEVRKTARETVAEDLKQWQEKFAKAAEEGAEEIEDRIAEIARGMVQESAHKKGRSLVKALEQTVESETGLLKHAINTIVDEGGEDAGDELIAAIRRVGFAVKEKAQAVRDWNAEFERDMEQAITTAAENHFKILTGIRDHALQRIGMKWAWMDGVTYKDWAKFHELRDKFEEWTNGLRQLIVTHPALDYAREASAAVEDSGMAAAQEAAQELSRLKEVAFWKLAAADTSDNFGSDAMRDAAEAAEKVKIQAAKASRAAEEAAESVRAVEQEIDDSFNDSSDDDMEAVEGESEPEHDPLEEAASVIEDESPATDIPDQADEDVPGPEEDPLESAAGVVVDESPADDLHNSEEPITAEASSLADDVIESASTATDSASSVVEEVASAASESVDSAISEGSTIIAGDEAEPDLASTVLPGQDDTIIAEGPHDDDSQKPLSPEEEAGQQLEEEIVAESAEDTPLEAETATVKPAAFGAMAQEVPDRGGPVLDDDEENEPFSERAHDAYSRAVKQAAERYAIAVSAVSHKIHGTPEPEPVQEQMFAAVSSRYAAAIDVANSRFHQALDAASKGVYGTPTPTPSPVYDWVHVESLAAERLHEGRIWAEEQYEAAKIALGLATATSTVTNEKLLEQARANYYVGLGAAQARYSEFLNAASLALSSVTATQTPTDAAETASSVASDVAGSAHAVASGASEEGMAVASAVGQGVDAAASVVGEAVNAAAQEVVDAAEAVEHNVGVMWERVIDHISAQVYEAPTPTPMPDATPAAGWYGKAYDDVEKYAARASSEAAKQYEVVYNIVQELVVGKEPSVSESVLGRLQAAYEAGATDAQEYLQQATQAAGDSAEAAREKVNSAAAKAGEAIKGEEHDGRDEL